MFRSDDPIADFNRHESRREAELARLPRCSICDEPITDEYAYVINDEWICEECLNNNFRVEVDDFIE